MIFTRRQLERTSSIGLVRCVPWAGIVWPLVSNKTSASSLPLPTELVQLVELGLARAELRLHGLDILYMYMMHNSWSEQAFHHTNNAHTN